MILRQRRSRLFLGLAICLWLCPALSCAALFVAAPGEVPQGAAVPVRLSSDEAVRRVTVRWRDTTFSVPMAAERGGGMWSGLALLPMPLEGSRALTLKATAGKNAASAAIRPRAVVWPRQEIRVDRNYVSPPSNMRKRIEDEQRAIRELLGRISPERLWDMPCVRPVPGGVSSVFGGQRVFNGQPRSRHRGADLRAAAGEPVLAMAGGRVVLAGEQYFSGNVVFIDHGLGVVSLYAHLSALRVSGGDVVRAGQEIGLAGATGRVTGPHLHWGVNILGKPVDPLSLLGGRL